MKYFKLLDRIINYGWSQKNKKGDITFLINERLSHSPKELEKLFSEYPVAKTKLQKELDLYMAGETEVEKYNEEGIFWWDYTAPTMINTYPTYFKKLPALINEINKSKKTSKNWVLFLGETAVETSQLPCLSLIQFQLINEELYITVYQRSADSNLGLPSDIYQMTLIADLINYPLADITFFIGNAHIYENNIEATKIMLEQKSKEGVQFNLNV
jgi:thymidylate synthase